jgi:trk system potassium uptake protein TrkH
MATVLTLRFGLGYGMPWPEAIWQGLFHAVSAFNNAGFSTWSDSLMGFVGDAYVLVPLMLAIIIGGLGFPVLQELIVERGQRRPIWSMHVVLTIWGSIALILGGALIIFLTEMDNAKTLGPLDWAVKGMAALFSSVSARTAGFNVIDIGGLTNESLALHFALMFIGGGSAGTAGGVKVTTFFVLVLVVWSEIRGNPDVEFRGRRIAEPVQRQALTVVALGSATITLAMLLILPLTSLPYEKVLFEVISAFATVGLSTGITAELVPGAQFILIALMFVGRVGVVTLAVAIATNQLRRNYRYPEEKPIVG